MKSNWILFPALSAASTLLAPLHLPAEAADAPRRGRALDTAPPAPARKPPLDFQFARDYVPGSRDANGKWSGGTETMRLLAYGGKLFAGLGYWMDLPYGEDKGDEPWTGAQVLVKESAAGPWRVDVSFGPEYGRT